MLKAQFLFSLLVFEERRVSLDELAQFLTTFAAKVGNAGGGCRK
jgi:hypothetical protein